MKVKLGSTCLRRLTPEWVVRPCLPNGSSFIACATMHCLLRSQPFSCPLVLILQEHHQGDHCSNMDLIFWYFAKKTNRNDQSYFPLRTKNSIFNQRRRSFQAPKAKKQNDDRWRTMKSNLIYFVQNVLPIAFRCKLCDLLCSCTTLLLASHSSFIINRSLLEPKQDLQKE